MVFRHHLTDPAARAAAKRSFRGDGKQLRYDRAHSDPCDAVREDFDSRPRVEESGDHGLR